jgi:hypothetical protein
VLNWPGAMGLVAFGLLPELLPLLFGTGEHARWDWGFPYVTLHFVLLPPMCLFFLVGGIVQVVRGPGKARRAADAFQGIPGRRLVLTLSHARAT